jgi:REP element-mobilizing transposase RayT
MKYSEWNETGIPLAYLITFRCYGTWLHGDERGSVDEFNNKFDTPFLPANPKWKEFNEKLLKHKPVKLNSERRDDVEFAIRETCKIRSWQLHALNVRTNHIHIVVSVGETSSRKVLSAFKANSTRKMRENKSWQFEHSPWAEHGSRRFLWTEKSIEIAIDYVINRQGKPLPDFNT